MIIMDIFQGIGKLFVQGRGIVIKTLICLLWGTMIAVGSASASYCALETDMVIPEDTLLSEYSEVVSRPDPDSLFFVLDSGDTLALSNSNAVHTLCGYQPDVNYFTVNVFGFEYSLFMLVNCNNGSKFFAVSPPIQSPDGQRLLCAWSSPAGYSFYQNGIQIFRLEEDSLVLEFSGTDCNWYPETVRWLSNTAVAYSRLPLFSSDSTLEGSTISLDVAGNWILKHPEHWSGAYRGGIQVFQWVEDLYLSSK